jgi:hypothetical protein
MQFNHVSVVYFTEKQGEKGEMLLRLSYFVLTVLFKDTVSCQQMNEIRVYRTGGMVRPEENQNTRRKTSPCFTLPTLNLALTSLELNLGLRGESPATNRLNHGMVY